MKILHKLIILLPVDEADFLSLGKGLVTGGTGGLGGFPIEVPFDVDVVPDGPTVTLVGGLLYKFLKEKAIIFN